MGTDFSLNGFGMQGVDQFLPLKLQAIKAPQNPIEDLLVVELAAVLAGPAVGMFFAELGARVVKIENARTGGDVTRNWKLPTESPDAPTSAYYQSVNYGKETRLLDLSDPDHYEDVLDLIDRADVVISNFRPASAHKLKLDAATLRARNPRLIYAQLYGFGPDDDRPAFDVVLQAEAGFLHLTGQPDGPPAKMPVALIDLLAAHQLKEGILLALWQRERTDRGATVSTSLLAAALASLANQATNWTIAGQIPQRMGTRHPNIAPYGDLFRCSDKKEVVLAVGTEGHFSELCELLQLHELATDERFRTNTTRVRHREELNRLLAPAIEKFPIDEFLEHCRKRSIPAGRIRNMQEVFEQPGAAEMLLPGGVVRSVGFSMDTDRGG